MPPNSITVVPGGLLTSARPSDLRICCRGHVSPVSEMGGEAEPEGPVAGHPFATGGGGMEWYGPSQAGVNQERSTTPRVEVRHRALAQLPDAAGDLDRLIVSGESLPGW